MTTEEIEALRDEWRECYRTICETCDLSAYDKALDRLEEIEIKLRNADESEMS